MTMALVLVQATVNSTINYILVYIDKFLIDHICSQTFPIICTFHWVDMKLKPIHESLLFSMPVHWWPILWHITHHLDIN